MHTETIKLPSKQILIKHDEAMSGLGVALARVNASLFAVYNIMPNGCVEDPFYTANETTANGLFESRLMGSC
jgi:hypothetical protein